MAYITGKDYVPVTQDRLFSALGMADGQRADAQRALHALCAAGEVRVSKHGRVYANNEEYLCGRFSASTRGFGFVRGREDGAEEIFIPPNATLGAIDGDTVRYTVTSDRPGGRTEGRVSAVLAHAVESVIGTLTEIRSPHSGRIRFALQPDRKQLSFLVYTDNAADVGARAGMKAEARITAYPDGEHDALGHITTVFGPADSADANYTAILHEYGIKTVFDRGVVRLAEERAAAPVLPDGRLDLRDAVIFTVDGAHSKDLDDAISVVRTDEGYELGVHIADVSHYVTEGDPLDLEAFARGGPVRRRLFPARRRGPLCPLRLYLPRRAGQSSGYHPCAHGHSLVRARGIRGDQRLFREWFSLGLCRQVSACGSNAVRRPCAL